MEPSVLTSAFRLEMTQSWPGGWTPRTMLRLTVAAVGPGPGALDTGITPIPPSKRTRRSSACAENAASDSAAAMTVTFISRTSQVQVGLHPANTCARSVFRPGLGRPNEKGGRRAAFRARQICASGHEEVRAVARLRRQIADRAAAGDALAR